MPSALDFSIFSAHIFIVRTDGACIRIYHIMHSLHTTSGLNCFITFLLSSMAESFKTPSKLDYVEHNLILCHAVNLRKKFC